MTREDFIGAVICEAKFEESVGACGRWENRGVHRTERFPKTQEFQFKEQKSPGQTEDKLITVFWD